MLQLGRSRGFARAELLMGSVIVIAVALVALPKVHRTRMINYENSAIRGIITLHTAEAQYRSRFGRYATLPELGPDFENLIPADLAQGKKGGYVFQLELAAGGYQIHVNPDAFGSANKCRTFYSDQTQIIRENLAREPATAHSKEIN